MSVLQQHGFNVAISPESCVGNNAVALLSNLHFLGPLKNTAQHDAIMEREGFLRCLLGDQQVTIEGRTFPSPKVLSSANELTEIAYENVYCFLDEIAGRRSRAPELRQAFAKLERGSG